MPKKMIFKMSNELQDKLLNEYVDMVSEFAGIEKDKLLSITQEHSVNHIFEHIDQLKLLPEQKDKLKKLRSLNEFSRLLVKQEKSLVLKNSESEIFSVSENTKIKENCMKNFDINRIKSIEKNISLER